MNTDFSGKFVLRLPADLHRQLSRSADNRKVSLNHLCIELLSKTFGDPKNKIDNRYQRIIKKHLEKFGDDLLGVLMFGSQVSGQATEDSDVDLLIVLSDKIALTRSLYRFWDDEVDQNKKPTINPQFVHLPSPATKAGGLWLEVALNNIVLWEKDKSVSLAIDTLKNLVADGLMTRTWSHGHPVWSEVLIHEK